MYSDIFELNNVWVLSVEPYHLWMTLVGGNCHRRQHATSIQALIISLTCSKRHPLGSRQEQCATLQYN